MPVFTGHRVSPPASGSPTGVTAGGRGLYRPVRRQVQVNVPDLMSMLRIVSESGIVGLQEAMRGKKELLPAMAAIGLAP
jgi:hypothetical protein